MSRRRVEERIAAITALRDAEPDEPDVRRELDRALDAKTGLVVAAAAKVAGELQIEALAPALVRALGRLLDAPAKADPGCHAKRAIVEALDALEHGDDDALLIRGMRHVQLEPVWGGREDTAASLRAACALALVRSRSPDAIVELVRLLTDPEPSPRAAAARGLAGLGDGAVVPLLLYKCRIGDDSPQVLGECFGALLDAGDEIGLDYAIECLGDEDGVRAHTAALALGQSRRGEALPALIEFAGTNCYGPNWRVGLVAIATLRTEAALDHLVALIAEADAEEAAGALDALSMYAMDRRLAERVRGAVARRGDDALARDLAARFPN